jgi:hypothetical protein
LAFLKTLEKHRATISRRGDAPSTSERILRNRVARVDEEYASEAEFEEATDDAMASAAAAVVSGSRDERKILDRLYEWATQASVRPDSKCRLLIDWLNSQLKPDGEWTDERVLIFTEYRDTQDWLVERLAVAGLTAEGRIETIYGGMKEDERERIKAHFQHDPKETPVRILIATECASEGIDLQRFCNKLVHIEIPWNPNRLEQRNGRIDRRGQKRTPYIHHFVGHGYKERAAKNAGLPASQLEGDLEFLMRAAEKVEKIRQDLGKVGPVIADQVEQAMLGQRRTLDTAAAEEEAGIARRQLKFERNVAERVQRLKERLTETRDSLRLDPIHVHNAVSTALSLAGLPQLVPASLPGARGAAAFKMPALPGSWQRCAEGLEDAVSHRVRPITFDHETADGRTDVVLAHLNHRLVQMSLRLLRAEIWQAEDRKKLHRITARSVPSTLLVSPAVVVHGRLIVAGASHQRLHEELITAGGMLKAGRWERFPQGTMEELLAAAGSEMPPNAPEAELLELVREFEDRAVSALEARMRDRVGSIERELEQRRDRDIADIEKVIRELEQSIRASFDAATQGQLYLEGLEPDEREQLDRNRVALERRLASLPEELEREQEAIRVRYSSPEPRLFPLAVTILVPEGWRHG